MNPVMNIVRSDRGYFLLRNGCSDVRVSERINAWKSRPHEG